MPIPFAAQSDTALNAICPYFTMFPLGFPLTILRRRAIPGQTVCDPFCGRGTTSFAARLLGLSSIATDSSRVAAAITAAKLVSVHPRALVDEAAQLLKSEMKVRIPSGDFWKLAFHPEVLRPLCILRETLLQTSASAERIALRAVVLGALHGPRQKGTASYLSNQCPRTFSPKPAYAVRFWRAQGMRPAKISLIDVISKRANRYYAASRKALGTVRLADSRRKESFSWLGQRKIDWVITSPPYYGMRTYVPDQWLRNWFLGGPDRVDYASQRQLSHSSPDEFADDLRKVWVNVASLSRSGAKMVVRFGGIPDRKAEPVGLLRESLSGTAWRIQTIKPAGDAMRGRRQAHGFLLKSNKPVLEHDIWAVRE